jgi:acylphosphatase
VTHYHIIVHGIVQGVGFRFFTMREAMRNGINGWVRNNGNGTVEIDAEGGEEGMAEFVKALGMGPESASVKSLDIRRINEVAYHSSFRFAKDE